MKELKIETGLVEYNLNGAVKVSFNPADPAFANRLYKAFDTLKEKQEHENVDLEKMSAGETFGYLERIDGEMRETIDSVFGVPVCAALFPEISLYAMADGLPVWMQFMTAIMDELDEGIKREQSFYSDKLAKYTKKYKR